MSEWESWEWTAALVKDGHRFSNGVWCCTLCRRKVFDLLRDRPLCRSPWAGEYLFVGGPYDGEWKVVGSPVPISIAVMMPLMSLAVTFDPEGTVHDAATQHGFYHMVSGDSSWRFYQFEERW